MAGSGGERTTGGGGARPSPAAARPAWPRSWAPPGRAILVVGDRGATDEELLRRIAGCVHLAEVHVRRGQPAGAAALYGTAADAAERLARRRPDEDAPLEHLSACLDALGVAARAAGRHERARTAFLRALEVDRELLARRPGDPVRHHDLGIALRRLGEVELAAGAASAAEERLREAAEHFDVVRAMLPVASAAVAALADTCGLAADAARAAGDAEADDRAAAWLRRALDAAREELRLRADDPAARWALGAGAARLAEFEEERGRLEAAAEAWRQAVDAARPVAEATPRLRRAFSGLCTRLGAALAELGRLDEAARAHAEALDLDRALLAEEPGDAVLARNLGVSCLHLGETERRRGRLEEAAGLACEAERAAARLPPADARPLLRQVAALLVSVAEDEAGTGRTGRAAGHLSRAIAVLDPLVRAAPPGDDAAVQLRFALFERARLHVRRRRPGPAVADLRRVFELERSLPAGAPRPSWVVLLARVVHHVGPAGVWHLLRDALRRRR